MFSDRKNVIQFSTYYVYHFYCFRLLYDIKHTYHFFLFHGHSGSSTYNKSNLKEALSLQMKMDADMGGTEIYEPFKHIYGKKVSKGHPRQVYGFIHIIQNEYEISNYKVKRKQ